MEEFLDSYLLRDFARAMRADSSKLDEAPRFACRPLAASTSGRSTVIGRFKGDIGLPNRQEFKDALDDLIADNPLKLMLDLSEPSLTRSAVGILVDFAATGLGRNKRMYLYRPSEQVRALLKELKLTDFFSYLETEEDVIASLVV